MQQSLKTMLTLGVLAVVLVLMAVPRVPAAHQAAAEPGHGAAPLLPARTRTSRRAAPSPRDGDRQRLQRLSTEPRADSPTPRWPCWQRRASAAADRQHRPHHPRQARPGVGGEQAEPGCASWRHTWVLGLPSSRRPLRVWGVMVVVGDNFSQTLAPGKRKVTAARATTICRPTPDPVE